jgi:hypothetical protein
MSDDTPPFCLPNGHAEVKQSLPRDAHGTHFLCTKHVKLMSQFGRVYEVSLRPTPLTLSALSAKRLIRADDALDAASVESRFEEAGDEEAAEKEGVKPFAFGFVNRGSIAKCRHRRLRQQQRGCKPSGCHAHVNATLTDQKPYSRT